jgi:ATP-binding cassette, subfamily C, bacterial
MPPTIRYSDTVHDLHPLRMMRDHVRAMPRGPMVRLAITMVLIAATEGVGIVMLVPLLGMAAEGGQLPAWLPGQDLAAIDRTTLLALSLIGFVTLVAFRAWLQAMQASLTIRIQNDTVDGLRQSAFDHVLRAEWLWLAQRRASDHASLLLGTVSRAGLASDQIVMLAASAVTVTILLAAALLLSWRGVLLLAAGAVLMAICVAGYREQARRLGRAMVDINRDFHAQIHDSMAGIRLIKMAGAEGRQSAIFADLMLRLRRGEKTLGRNASINRAIAQIGSALLLSLFLFAGSSYWAMPLVEMAAVVIVFARLVPLLTGMLHSWHVWIECCPSLAAVRELDRDAAAAAEVAESGGPIPLRHAITLSEVSLTYAGRARPALDQASIQLPVNTTTAIIGPSGAGKSSLADLLAGMISPDRGSFAIDGQVIAGGQRQQWRRGVAYVPQHAFFLHASIRANLLWLTPKASEAELQQAITTAGATFVFDLPDGLDTIVGDNAVRLSGGERQRLALARALLHEPELIILDEATSALDPDNEALVIEALDRLRGQVTIVLIGHRLSMLDRVDRIIAVERGRVHDMTPAAGAAVMPIHE